MFLSPEHLFFVYNLNATTLINYPKTKFLWFR